MVQETLEWVAEHAERERRQARMMVLIRRDDRQRNERAERSGWRPSPWQDEDLFNLFFVKATYV